MIQVIKRALHIVEFVASKNNEAATLSEIAADCQLSHTTTANIIKTLVDANYLEHLGRKKGYKLGPKLFQLTGNRTYSENLLQAAKDEMEKLTATLNETCILGILKNQKRFILHIVNSDQDLQVRSRTERNIYETASGRLLVAFLPEHDRNALLKGIGLPEGDTWKEVKSVKSLNHELEKIRDEQLAFTLSPSHIVGLAVPIFKDEKVIAALSVFLPQSRYTDKKRADYITTILKNTAFAIMKKL